MDGRRMNRVIELSMGVIPAPEWADGVRMRTDGQPDRRFSTGRKLVAYIAGMEAKTISDPSIIEKLRKSNEIPGIHTPH